MRARGLTTTAWVAFAVACAVTGCGSHPRPAGPDTTVGTAAHRTVPTAVADLRFTDTEGKAVTLASLHGKTVVLTDFLSLCQEVCPLTSANLGRVQQAVAAASLRDGVELVEVTVDPARDDRQRLGAYAKVIGAQGNWRLLTGSATDVAALWRWFGVAYERQPEPSPAGVDWWTGRTLTYDVGHSDVLFFLDTRGTERYLISGPPNASGSAVAAPLSSFLNAEGRSNLRSPDAGAWTATDVDAVLTWLTGHHVGGG